MKPCCMKKKKPPKLPTVIWRFHTGETVKAALKRRGINANQLHALMGCSHQAAYQWAKGFEPHYLYQPLLASALKVPKAAK